MTKVRQREAANRPVDQATLSVNERILKECHQLYTDPENGLVRTFWYLENRVNHISCLNLGIIHKWVKQVWRDVWTLVKLTVWKLSWYSVSSTLEWMNEWKVYFLLSNTTFINEKRFTHCLHAYEYFSVCNSAPTNWSSNVYHVWVYHKITVIWTQ